MIRLFLTRKINLLHCQLIRVQENIHTPEAIITRGMITRIVEVTSKQFQIFRFFAFYALCPFRICPNPFPCSLKWLYFMASNHKMQFTRCFCLPPLLSIYPINIIFSDSSFLIYPRNFKRPFLIVLLVAYILKENFSLLACTFNGILYFHGYFLCLILFDSNDFLFLIECFEQYILWSSSLAN